MRYVVDVEYEVWDANHHYVIGKKKSLKLTQEEIPLPDYLLEGLKTNEMDSRVVLQMWLRDMLIDKLFYDAILSGTMRAGPSKTVALMKVEVTYPNPGGEDLVVAVEPLMTFPQILFFLETNACRRRQQDRLKREDEAPSEPA